MKDITEIRAQIRTNPDAVLFVWPTYTPDALNDPRDELLWGWNKSEREVVLRLGRFPIYFHAEVGDPAREEIPRSSLLVLPSTGPAKMKHWGLTKLGSGVWAVSPSIHLPDAFHGYIVLCDAPEPAPWEM